MSVLGILSPNTFFVVFLRHVLVFMSFSPRFLMKHSKKDRPRHDRAAIGKISSLR